MSRREEKQTHPVVKIFKILLTLVISCAAALIRPITEEQEGRA